MDHNADQECSLVATKQRISGPRNLSNGKPASRTLRTFAGKIRTGVDMRDERQRAGSHGTDLPLETGSPADRSRCWSRSPTGEPRVVKFWATATRACGTCEPGHRSTAVQDAGLAWSSRPGIPLGYVEKALYLRRSRTGNRRADHGRAAECDFHQLFGPRTRENTTTGRHRACWRRAGMNSLPGSDPPRRRADMIAKLLVPALKAGGRVEDTATRRAARANARPFNFGSRRSRLERRTGCCSE